MKTIDLTLRDFPMLNSNLFIRLLIAFLFCCFSSAAFAFELEYEEVLLNKQIQSIVNKSRIKYSLPALSVSIKMPEDNRTKNYLSGYHSLSSNKKITADTLFQIGSITKTFTATMVFKLIEENKLNLNDSLRRLLPQYPRWKNITVDNLLRHTSGIYNYTSGQSFDNLLRKNPNKYFSLNELADISYKHTDLSNPGEKYNYTNTDYVLLGMIIEKVTNKSIQQVFDDYLKQYGLSYTFYAPSGYPDKVKNLIAHGYNRDGTFQFNKDVTFVSMSSGQSAGAMIATPSDVIDWLNQLFSRKIITNKSLIDMMTIISGDNAKPINLKNLRLSKLQMDQKPFTEIGLGSGIGFLYFRDFGFTWAHAGGEPGYESFYAYNPCNGIYVVIMYNAKLKQQLIYTKIANDIFKILRKSALVSNTVNQYQRDHVLPKYCQTRTTPKLHNNQID